MSLTSFYNIYFVTYFTMNVFWAILDNFNVLHITNPLTKRTTPYDIKPHCTIVNASTILISNNGAHVVIVDETGIAILHFENEILTKLVRIELHITSFTKCHYDNVCKHIILIEHN